MTAKKVTKTAAAAKVKAANAAKRAKLAAKAKPVAKGRKGPKLLAKMFPMNAKARAEVAAAKPARKTPVRMVGSDNAPVVGGAKGKVIEMIAAAGSAGVSAAEIAKALGWPRAGGTISRAIAIASFKVAKVRDADGVLRYSRKA